jgi:mannitol/fructose-specific phosphotransferase system IIA component (Ntr-type)
MDKANKLSSLIDFHKNINKRAIYLLQPEYITINLKGGTKVTVINELLDVLVVHGKLLGRDTALKDILDRERAMSTAIPNGIAIPHAKTNTVRELAIAIGTKKSGLEFASPLDDKTHIIILAIAPPDKSKSLYKFLLAITTALNDDTFRSKILVSKTPKEIAELLHQYQSCNTSNE